MTTIGFIGTGEIAAALVTGLAGQGHQLVVSDRGAKTAAKLSETFSDVCVAANADVVRQCDVIFLCLLADVAKQVLPVLPLRAEQTVISVMVDVSFDHLTQLCSPVTDIAIAIPLPSIAGGGSALPVYPENAVLRGLFGGRNQILSCPSENALNAHFAASALASAILDQMREGASWLADQTGDAAAAQAYVRAIFSGFLAEMAADPSVGFERQLEALATEGGLNATLRAHMRDHDALTALRSGLDALKPRLGLSDEK